MTFEFFDDETNYVSKRQVSQEVRARITAKLGKISSMISQVSQKLVPDFRKQSFFGDYFFVKSIKHKNCVQNRKISVQLCLYKLR